MSRDAFDQLEALYAAIETSCHVSAGSTALADAVHFGTNRERPIHRWFHFKEGFSADLFTALNLDARPMLGADAVFLDPFCGSGTTLVAGDIDGCWQGRRVGFEINPFIAFVAQTKMSWRAYDPVRMQRYAKKLLASPLNEDFASKPRPALSTFDRPEMFPPKRLSALLDAVQRIERLKVPEAKPLLLGVAAAADRVGFYRKDGRALRILKSESELDERRGLTVAAELQRRWKAMVEDLKSLESRRDASSSGQGNVVVGDGRSLAFPKELDIGGGDVSLIAYSPPYLNHIDYTEVYKVELWLLGFVQSQQEMLHLRKQTLRSHASIGIESATMTLPSDVQEALTAATNLVVGSGTAWHRAFPRLATAYLDDMKASLKRQFTLLQPGGRAVCVVANSAHGARQQRVPIAVDLFIARLAEEVGFDIERFVVARQLLRRDHLNRFLRETAIVLRRPLDL